LYETANIPKQFSNKEVTVRGEDGKQIIFSSMIKALNFVTKKGFEFVQAYAITLDNRNVYQYLLRKKGWSGNTSIDNESPATLVGLFPFKRSGPADRIRVATSNGEAALPGQRGRGRLVGQTTAREEMPL
jgi:hypothetical protein